jgi:hypothetical protein
MEAAGYMALNSRTQQYQKFSILKIRKRKLRDAENWIYGCDVEGDFTVSYQKVT